MMILYHPQALLNVVETPLQISIKKLLILDQLSYIKYAPAAIAVTAKPIGLVKNSFPTVAIS